jgi:branched-chain amino acid transport system permease protein
MDSANLLLNLVLEGIATGSIYALVAIGFSLLWWLGDIVHLAHGGVLLGAGYAMFYVLSVLGWPILLAFPAGIALAVVLGVLVDRVIYAPMLERGSSEMALLTASLGVLIVFEYALTLLFGPEGVTLDAGALRTPLTPSLLAVDRYAVLAVGGTLALFLGVGAFMRYSATGKAMRAVAENRELARVLGMDTRAVQRKATMLAAALVTPAAMLLLFSTGMAPHESLHLVLVAAVIAILGGRGSILGALVGGLLIGLAESVMQWQFAAGWRQLVTFSVLYVLLLVRPQGLFGAKA